MLAKDKPSIDKESVWAILKKINDPELHRSLVDLGMVEKVDINGSTVTVKIKLTVPGCPLKHRISDDITTAVRTVPGVENVDVEFSYMSPQERAALTSMMSGQAKSPLFDDTRIKNILAIASGKGGVGKSTVAVNLAYALHQEGKTVGVLDADVYGFSIPRMMGIWELPTAIDEMIIPIVKDGIKIMSMGFFVDEDQAIIWRGPMLHKAVVQFLTQVFWDRLDFLLIDLPPGTGDVTLSIAQTVPHSNLLIVTTPQKAAATVAQRVAELARKANLRTIGVIENMSYFLTPDNNRYYIFGRDGGAELAEKLGQPLLAQIPLELAVREGSDNGQPIVIQGTGQAAKEFRNLAEKIIKLLG